MPHDPETHLETVFDYSRVTLRHLVAAQRELLRGAQDMAAEVEAGALTPAQLREHMVLLVMAARETALALEAFARDAAAKGGA